MDLGWEDQFQDLDLKMKPSESWARQCYATYQTDPVGIRLLDVLGEDNVMWGSDFPHPDGIWPDSQEFLTKELTGISAETKRKVVRDNAMKLYRLGNLSGSGPGRQQERACQVGLNSLGGLVP